MAKPKTRKPPPKRPASRPRPPAGAASAAPARPATNRTPLYLALVVVVLVAAVAIGIASTRGGDDGDDAASGSEACEQIRADVAPVSPVTNPPELGSEVQAVTIDGTPLPAIPQGGGPECAVGEAAPTVTGASFDGSPVSIAPGGGTPMLVLFVAHWCPHCQAEVPLLADWIEAGENPQSVPIVTVSTAVEPSADNYPPSAWLQGVEWPTPVLADDAGRSAAAAYGLSAFPYYVVLDGDGVVVDRFTGEIEPAALATRVTNALA